MSTRALNVPADAETQVIAPDRPRPLGASETARALLAAKSRQTLAHPTVKLSRNTAGNVQPDVSIPAGVIEGIDTPEQAMQECIRLFDILCTAYPYVDPKAAK